MRVVVVSLRAISKRSPIQRKSESKAKLLPQNVTLSLSALFRKEETSHWSITFLCILKAKLEPNGAEIAPCGEIALNFL